MDEEAVRHHPRVILMNEDNTIREAKLRPLPRLIERKIRRNDPGTGCRGPLFSLGVDQMQLDHDPITSRRSATSTVPSLLTSA